MTFSLYDAVVPSNIQILGSVVHLLDKAESWCSEHGHDAQKVIGARLAENMHGFDYQVKSTAVHSLDAITGARAGAFSPDRSPPPSDFAGLKAKVTDAITGLEALDPAVVNDLVGQDVIFSAGDFRIPFKAENFLLSFSQPNFYFHATTTYDLLRLLGVPLGKLDFMGRLRVAV